MLHGLLATQLFITLTLVGLIWFVQVVHYPLFALLGASFPTYHRQHVRRTGWVVAPLMVAEAVLAIALVWRQSTEVSPAATWLGLGLLSLIWTSTFAVQVPLHKRLERGYNAAVCSRLVRSNWNRTVAWTLRGVLAVWMAYAASGR